MNSTPIETIDPQNPRSDQIDQAAAILNNDGIIIAPTETRYGMLALIDSQKALGDIFRLKKRPAEMATSIFLNDTNEIDGYGIETEISKKLAEKFLPGPLTLVLESRTDFGPPITVNGKIGIRVSSSPVIRDLLKKTRGPLSATSANISGSGDLQTIEEIYQVFGSEINLYLDSGRLNSLTSTVVECIEEPLKVLREGAILSKDIVDAAKKD